MCRELHACSFNAFKYVFHPSIDTRFVFYFSICPDILFFSFTAVIVSSVDAVLGRSATLPCDIEPGIREDRVYMVLWYRDKHIKPIYR